jgi:hypothetical protein
MFFSCADWEAARDKLEMQIPQ